MTLTVEGFDKLINFQLLFHASGFANLLVPNVLGKHRAYLLLARVPVSTIFDSTGRLDNDAVAE